MPAGGYSKGSSALRGGNSSGGSKSAKPREEKQKGVDKKSAKQVKKAPRPKVLEQMAKKAAQKLKIKERKEAVREGTAGAGGQGGKWKNGDKGKEEEWWGEVSGRL